MVYEKQQAVIDRKNKLHLTNRDIANILDKPPGTVAGKLNGFIPLLLEERNKINRFFDDYEKNIIEKVFNE